MFTLTAFWLLLQNAHETKQSTAREAAPRTSGRTPATRRATTHRCSVCRDREFRFCETPKLKGCQFTQSHLFHAFSQTFATCSILASFWPQKCDNSARVSNLNEVQVRPHQKQLKNVTMFRVGEGSTSAGEKLLVVFQMFLLRSRRKSAQSRVVLVPTCDRQRSKRRLQYVSSAFCLALTAFVCNCSQE